ncbi:MAG: transglycosylase SLT domain-containing protein [Gemmatimonadetes bacterium]|nr:transglycosylase SLT domain-containing protein [Gemmatimonadota bacterium]
MIPPRPVVRDEILSSPMARNPDFQARVAHWIEFWQTTGSSWFPGYLERMERFGPVVDSALSNRGLPPSLRYLPIVESGYSPRAVSSASAAGLWQLMSGTAQGYGMWVGPLLDERRNPFKATAAAADFLQRLKDQFGSWFLALAAYNAGPYRMERILDRYAPLMPRTDSLYWAIRTRLPAETRDFVPKFFAAVELGRNPEVYGFQAAADSMGFDYDEVVIPDATTMDVVAQAAEVPQEEIERLNPEVVRGITPPGKKTVLRVPAGRGETFVENYAKIPPSERVTFVEHRVQRGETLSHIALRYHVPVKEIEAANPGLRPRRLQIGQRITVPVAPSARRSRAASVRH